MKKDWTVVNITSFTKIATIFSFLALIGLFVFLTQNRVFAQSGDPTTIITVPVIPTPKISEPNETEVEVLKAQLEIQSVYADRLTNVFIGTGAILITLISVFLGVNLFVSRQQYQSDIKKIASQLQQSIEQKIEKKLSSISIDQDQKIQVIQAQNDSKIESKFYDFQRVLVKIQIEQLGMEAKEWATKGVVLNEIRRYLEIIQLKPYDFIVERTLDNLKNALRKDRVHLGAELMAEIVTAVKNLDNKYSSYGDQIIEIAKTIV